MTQGERVKDVRKKLGLTMEKFGERLGIKKGAISLIENSKNNLTDANIKAICREFDVNYLWLTTGEGTMFTQLDDNLTEKFHHMMASDNETIKNIFRTILSASDEDLTALTQVIELFLNNQKD